METNTQTDAGDEKKNKKRSFLDNFPDWVSSNLKNPRSVKTLIRCCELSWRVEREREQDGRTPT